LLHARAGTHPFSSGTKQLENVDVFVVERRQRFPGFTLSGAKAPMGFVENDEYERVAQAAIGSGYPPNASNDYNMN
jgi:hypothetical protein